MYTCGCVYVICSMCERCVWGGRGGGRVWALGICSSPRAAQQPPRTWSQPGSFGSLSEAAVPQRALPADFFRALELFTWERPPFLCQASPVYQSTHLTAPRNVSEISRER